MATELSYVRMKLSNEAKLAEYETYYTIKYGKKPKFIKKNTENLNIPGGPTKKREVKNNSKTRQASERVSSSLRKEKKSTSNVTLPRINDTTNNNTINNNNNNNNYNYNYNNTQNQSNNKSKKQPLSSESSSATLVDDSNDNFGGIIGTSVNI
ncbi:hypothetical protein PIROE2DRAFT_1180 [Piromyces sp. E2]|nr:hypothetical protein PIROE2DRAFT_1180 [Piromyces sp. E2]|eukprot:OUM70648.1 hypothetical protein PIROE2DRAFT_1180 [Piromyces sp. E2]